jgi:hypothetical protein
MIPASLAKTLQQKELCVGTSSAGFFVAMVEAFWCVTRRLNWKAITEDYLQRHNSLSPSF